MSIIAELKRRKTFRVAAVYAVIAWGIVQVIDVVNDPLNLPDWFSTVTILLLAVGFPIALVFSWIFDLGPEGITRTEGGPASRVSPRSSLEIILLLVLIVGIGWLIFRDVIDNSNAPSAAAGMPTIILMDTFAPRGVYDEETRRRSGTNADILSRILESLPVATQKEAIGSTWDREVQLLQQNPALIFIHRSAFFHSMARDLGIRYPEGAEAPGDDFVRLYQIAENKLVAFLGIVARSNPDTKFVVYSRGTGGGWPDADYRDNWLQQAEGRFPSLRGRVTAIAVPGGLSGGSFQGPEAAEIVRDLVQQLLPLKPEGAG